MKPKYLFIAEKPSLKRALVEAYEEIKDSLPYIATFVNSRGHVIRLAQPKEYMDAQNEQGKFTFSIPWIPSTYELRLVEENRSFFNDIQKAYQSRKWDAVVNACDPEREGQLIFWLITQYLHIKEPGKRVWSNDTSKESLCEALQMLRNNDSNEKFLTTDVMLKNLTDASILRSRNDLLVGMNFSSALNKAVGRVRTPSLSMVVKRDMEIENFIEKLTYELQDTFGNGMQATLVDYFAKNEFKRFDTINEVTEFAYQHLRDSAIVSKYESKDVYHNAPPLYKLSLLQADANKVLGMSAKEVLDICQALYERGVLSYPRTGCSCLSSNMIKQFPQLLRSLESVPEFAPYIASIDQASIDKVANSKIYIDDKKLAENGHSALIPTATAPDFNSLSEGEKAVFTLVGRRFLSIFLPPLVEEKTIVELDNNGYRFRTTGIITKSKGFIKLYNKEGTNTPVPILKVGDMLIVTSHDAIEKKSVPPQRFTEGTLIQAMENPVKYLYDESLKATLKSSNGIGTDATRYAIIEKLISSRQIERIKGKGKAEYLKSTNQGRALIRSLEGMDIIAVDMTGSWEEKLDAVAKGKLAFSEYQEQMENYIREEVPKYISHKVESIEENTEIGKCPFCKNTVYKKPWGYSCERYKECNFTVSYKDIQWLKNTFKISLGEKQIITILKMGSYKLKIPAYMCGKTIRFKKNDKGYFSWDIK